MMKTLSYPLTVEEHPKDGGFLAYFPSLPGCQSWGDTFETAVRNAEEALAVYIETLAANGDPIPETTRIDSPISLGIMVRANIVAA
jgi:antitoxin HicB